MDAGDTYLLIVLVILLILSAFFSSNETALMSVNTFRLRTLADEGNKRAAKVLDVKENHSAKMLNTILIGNNIVNISASSLAATLAYEFGGLMVSIVTVALTVIILIFGEVTPKNYAAINAEKITTRYIPILNVLMVIMTPVIFVLNAVSGVFLRLLRVDPEAVKKAMTEEDLRTIVNVSHEDGVIESGEKEIIYNVFDFGDARAKDIMVPRVNVTFADVNVSYGELLDIFREDMYTRLPVYEDTQDNIVGIINMKDLLLYDRKQKFRVCDFLRDAHFTYEYKSISDLMVEMRDAAFNIAIVLDEYGEMAGLITLEDILEEIVGEIHDEYDENEEDLIRQISEREYVVEGSVSLDDVNDRLGTGLESEDYDSLGGYIIELLDRLPEEGDEALTPSGIQLRVEKLDKNRVESVRVLLPEPAEEEDAVDSDEEAKEHEHRHSRRQKDAEQEGAQTAGKEIS